MSTDIHNMELRRNPEADIRDILDGINALYPETVTTEAVPSLFETSHITEVQTAEVDYSAWADQVVQNPRAYIESCVDIGRGHVQNQMYYVTAGAGQGTSVIDMFTSQSRDAKRRELMRHESQIGAQLFGVIPKGHKRDFFCFDERTWIWAEQWFDATKKADKMMQVKYEFQSRGVLKTVDGVATGFLEAQELAYLLEAMHTYQQRVSAEVYQQPVMPSPQAV